MRSACTAPLGGSVRSGDVVEKQHVPESGGASDLSIVKHAAEDLFVGVHSYSYMMLYAYMIKLLPVQ